MMLIFLIYFNFKNLVKVQIRFIDVSATNSGMHKPVDKVLKWLYIRIVSTQSSPLWDLYWEQGWHFRQMLKLPDVMSEMDRSAEQMQSTPWSHWMHKFQWDKNPDLIL